MGAAGGDDGTVAGVVTCAEFASQDGARRCRQATIPICEMDIWMARDLALRDRRAMDIGEVRCACPRSAFWSAFCVTSAPR